MGVGVSVAVSVTVEVAVAVAVEVAVAVAVSVSVEVGVNVGVKVGGGAPGRRICGPIQMAKSLKDEPLAYTVRMNLTFSPFSALRSISSEYHCPS